MSRLAFGLSGALLAVLLGSMCALLGLEALFEPPGQVAGKLFERGAVLLEDLYYQTLMLVPGSLTAGVASPKADARWENEEKPVDQDTLKQTVAKDESAINAQQEVSTKRYVEARDSAKQGSEPLVMPETPDEIRTRMSPVDPHGPEMRCGQALLPQSSVTTRDVELRAVATFVGRHGDQYSWKYVITFINHGTETVQMLTRHWVFVDSSGKMESEVKGPGARGVTPVLPPGGEWSYESGAGLPTPFGSMHGSFQFDILKGKPTAEGLYSFSARVGRLLLSSSKKDSSKKVPCVDMARAEDLPTTSVLAIERVILGGRSQAEGHKMVKKAGKKQKVYLFSYDVQFNNARDAPVEFLSHSWEVVDANGNRSIVEEGLGVGGSMGMNVRKLPAGDAFRVQGKLTSASPEANAQGTYKAIIRGEGNSFDEIEVRTDWMGLASRNSQTHVPNFVADPSFR